MTRRNVASNNREEAAEAMRTYLLSALPPHTRGVSLDDALCAVESIWNNYEPGAPAPPFDETGVDMESPAFQGLVERLHRERSGRFQSARYFIFALDYSYDGLDVVFTGDLWSDDFLIHPFELRIERAALSPPERN